jgi:hypothetical protein
MAHDVNPNNGYNSSMMIFPPSETKVEQITRLMDNCELAQPAINKALNEKIQEFNISPWLNS